MSNIHELVTFESCQLDSINRGRVGQQEQAASGPCVPSSAGQIDTIADGKMLPLGVSMTITWTITPATCDAR